MAIRIPARVEGHNNDGTISISLAVKYKGIVYHVSGTHNCPGGKELWYISKGCIDRDDPDTVLKKCPHCNRDLK